MALIRPSQMNRPSDSFFGQPSQPGLLEGAWAPPVEMYETKDEVVVAAEPMLPKTEGVKPREIKIDAA